ncbi:transposase family protein [Microbacterium sp. NEAU-LLC]|uniref:Transposase family protein n=1 Tax=Microbacterium helvum TaxID=2773713 RepID=A0ABR8NSS6_9MICO|nr:transposase family protein [Microbacterium helvum]
MSRVEPVDPRVRLAIAQWPLDAPRGAVTTFCAEHSISRKTFYAIRKRALVEGQAAALEPRSRRPKTSPTTIAAEVKKQAVAVRAALESSGLDHGPISVHDKMRSLGMTPVPSIAALARIFRETGVARAEPRKKPRAAYRRFVYPAPNACWQLDATEYVLVGGRKCVIFQLIDDHSRYAVASHAATGETSRDAIRVVRKAIKKHGVPQRLLSDNGIALNPSRRGIIGQLVEYVTGLGVEPITGKPYKPTTQGKNERFHQTLFRYLDKQPIAANLRELQAQIDQFDHIYNTDRPHQALPDRITPQAAWDATPKAAPPRPRPLPRKPHDPLPPAPSPNGRLRDGIRVATVHPNGSIKARGVIFNVSYPLRGQDVYVIYEAAGIMIFDDRGTLLAEHNWPPPGIKYVGNCKPRGPRGRELSPMS